MRGTSGNEAHSVRSENTCISDFIFPMNNLLKTAPWGKKARKDFLNRESNLSQPLQLLQPVPRNGVPEV